MLEHLLIVNCISECCHHDEQVSCNPICRSTTAWPRPYVLMQVKSLPCHHWQHLFKPKMNGLFVISVIAMNFRKNYNNGTLKSKELALELASY